MVKILDGKIIFGRTSYPWNEWTDGATREIEQGIDFHVSPRAFQRVAYNYAARHGMKAYTKVLDSGNVLLRFEKDE